MQQEQQAPMTYSINNLFELYSINNQEVFVFINPKRVYKHESIKGVFYTTKPIAVRSGGHTCVDIDDTSMVLKERIVKAVDGKDGYYVIIIDPMQNEFMNNDGGVFTYHKYSLMKVSNESTINKLKTYESEIKIREWDGEI